MESEKFIVTQSLLARFYLRIFHDPVNFNTPRPKKVTVDAPYVTEWRRVVNRALGPAGLNGNAKKWQFRSKE